MVNSRRSSTAPPPRASTPRRARDEAKSKIKENTIEDNKSERDGFLPGEKNPRARRFSAAGNKRGRKHTRKSIAIEEPSILAEDPAAAAETAILAEEPSAAGNTPMPPPLICLSTPNKAHEVAESQIQKFDSACDKESLVGTIPPPPPASTPNNKAHEEAQSKTKNCVSTEILSEGSFDCPSDEESLVGMKPPPLPAYTPNKAHEEAHTPSSFWNLTPSPNSISSDSPSTKPSSSSPFSHSQTNCLKESPTCEGSSAGKENVETQKYEEEEKSIQKLEASRFGGSLIKSNYVNGFEDGTKNAPTSATGPPSQAVESSHHPAAAKRHNDATTTTSKQQPDALLDLCLRDSGEDEARDPATAASATAVAVKQGGKDCVDNTSNPDTKECRACKSTSTSPFKENDDFGSQLPVRNLAAELLDKLAQLASHGYALALGNSGQGTSMTSCPIVAAASASAPTDSEVHGDKDCRENTYNGIQNSMYINASQQHGNEPQATDAANHASSRILAIHSINNAILAKRGMGLNQASASSHMSSKDRKGSIMKTPEKSMFAAMAQEAVRKRQSLKPTPLLGRPPLPPSSPFEFFNQELQTKCEAKGVID